MKHKILRSLGGGFIFVIKEVIDQGRVAVFGNYTFFYISYNFSPRMYMWGALKIHVHFGKSLAPPWLSILQLLHWPKNCGVDSFKFGSFILWEGEMCR